ncbi:TadE/TadG family type IV pilus assembly protein [Halomonas salifodinae]|uniref:TadE/TadG family type IV pilus assembly protein n=1 Tax=Halomonas salifodinae TaxID=438745 RepID=UPI0033A74033
MKIKMFDGNRNQRGAVAIEFVILFPLFLVIFYAIVSYSVIFATQQTLHSLSSEATRAAVAVHRNDPELSTSDIEAVIGGVIRESRKNSWIDGWLSHCESMSEYYLYSRGGAGGRDQLEVCFRVTVGTGKALALPRLNLGFSIPSEKITELTSTSSIRL